jgi:ElaB/YqjD/DUF883 family membrane-anchored ribosome-binding protein
METFFGEMQDNASAVSREKLAQDLRTLVRDAEEMLKATAGDVGEKMGEHAKAARSRLAAALESAKATCHQWEEKAVAGAKAADRAIRTHPYESIGIAFGVGLLIGVLVARK